MSPTIANGKRDPANRQVKLGGIYRRKTRSGSFRRPTWRWQYCPSLSEGKVSLGRFDMWHRRRSHVEIAERSFDHRTSKRLNASHYCAARMPSSACKNILKKHLTSL